MALHGRAADTPGRETPIVRQVDHVLAATTAPAELFAFLSDTLQLPVAWPLASFGGFSSGGVSLGNANLEILKDPGTAGTNRPARYTGLALEPAPLDRVTLPELDARGIRHGPPAPFPSPGPFGFRKPRWTTVSLPEVSGDTLEVFFCEYHQDVGSRRRELQQQLESRKGGPLGIVRAREILHGTSDLNRLGSRYARLLQPLPEDSAHRWKVGPGPRIGLRRSAAGTYLVLVLEVRSLSEARSALPRLGLQGLGDGDTLTVTGAPLQGLPLLLVGPEARASGR